MEDIKGTTEVEPIPAAMMKPESLPAPFMMMGGPQGLEPSPAALPAATMLEDAEDDLDDDDLDETVAERLWGLTEMFPESLRNITSAVATLSWQGSKALYSLSKSGVWVIASSAAILALPVMFEVERAQMEEQHMAQQRQILLGPNAAVSGSGAGLSPGAMPQVLPPQQR